jgi:hypothetical protein
MASIMVVYKEVKREIIRSHLRHFAKTATLTAIGFGGGSLLVHHSPNFSPWNPLLLWGGVTIFFGIIMSLFLYKELKDLTLRRIKYLVRRSKMRGLNVFFVPDLIPPSTRYHSDPSLN